MYQGLFSPNLRLRFASTAGGTARSLFRNGLPLIARIIQNVMNMTRRMIGIVQRMRRTTNFNISWLYFRCGLGVSPRGGLSRPPVKHVDQPMLTFVRSTVYIGLNAYPCTFVACWSADVYQ